MKFLRPLFSPLLGLATALLVCMAFLVLLGESPQVLVEALSNTLFSHFGLGYTLFYATPLIFTGLSVAVCFHCGLFNIGGEGQLYFGAVGAVMFATLFPNLPPFLALPLCIGMCAVMGGLWGGLAGWFKARRGSHEVIVTILMNFLAIAIVDYLILYPLKNHEIQNPETVQVSPAYFLPTLSELLSKVGSDLFRTTPVNSALFLALLCAGLCHYFLFHTTYGYELRAVGLNPTASRFAGINLSRNRVWAFVIAGALSGLVGVNEVQGYQHKLVEGFSPGYGFTGIAVALLARNHPIGIVFSAFLFGALQNSSRELEFISDKVSKEISLILQGTLIAFVAGHYLVQCLVNRLKKPGEPAHD